MTPCAEATIPVEPGATAVIVPDEFTVATAVLLEVQVTVPVAIEAPLSSTPAAVAVAVWPT